MATLWIYIKFRNLVTLSRNLNSYFVPFSNEHAAHTFYVERQMFICYDKNKHSSCARILMANFHPIRLVTLPSNLQKRVSPFLHTRKNRPYELAQWSSVNLQLQKGVYRCASSNRNFVKRHIHWLTANNYSFPTFSSFTSNYIDSVPFSMHFIHLVSVNGIMYS